MSLRLYIILTYITLLSYRFSGLGCLDIEVTLKTSPAPLTGNDHTCYTHLFRVSEHGVARSRITKSLFPRKIMAV